MAQSDSKKQEFVAAVATVAAVLAERWYEGWGNSPFTISAPAAEPSSEPLLNRKEAAKLLKCSVSTLGRLVDAGDITKKHLTGKKVPLYSREEIERYIRRLK
jgi:excisionase family DNA binding protein